MTTQDIIDELSFCSGFINGEIQFNGNDKFKIILEKIDNVIDNLKKGK